MRLGRMQIVAAALAVGLAGVSTFAVTQVNEANSLKRELVGYKVGRVEDAKRMEAMLSCADAAEYRLLHLSNPKNEWADNVGHQIVARQWLAGIYRARWGDGCQRSVVDKSLAGAVLTFEGTFQPLPADASQDLMIVRGIKESS